MRIRIKNIKKEVAMRVTKTAEEHKNEILDVAEQLFVQKGYDNTSTNDIIKVIGIARGTLYHHFASKEEILDATITRITDQMTAKAALIAKDRKTPLLERVTNVVLSMNVDSEIGQEVLNVIHRPQNALFHQKAQRLSLERIVPIIAGLIKEGNEEGIFDTRFPDEAAEMIVVYTNEVFEADEQDPKKIQAFIYHTERLLGAKEGSLMAPLMKIFGM